MESRTTPNAPSDSKTNPTKIGLFSAKQQNKDEIISHAQIEIGKDFQVWRMVALPENKVAVVILHQTRYQVCLKTDDAIEPGFIYVEFKKNKVYYSLITPIGILIKNFCADDNLPKNYLLRNFSQLDADIQKVAEANNHITASNHVEIWELSNNQKTVHAILPIGNLITAMEFNPYTKELFIGQREQFIIWDLKNNPRTLKFTEYFSQTLKTKKINSDQLHYFTFTFSKEGYVFINSFYYVIVLNLANPNKHWIFTPENFLKPESLNLPPELRITSANCAEAFSKKGLQVIFWNKNNSRPVYVVGLQVASTPYFENKSDCLVLPDKVLWCGSYQDWTGWKVHGGIQFITLKKSFFTSDLYHSIDTTKQLPFLSHLQFVFPDKKHGLYSDRYSLGIVDLENDRLSNSLKIFSPTDIVNTVLLTDGRVAAIASGKIHLLEYSFMKNYMLNNPQSKMLDEKTTINSESKASYQMKI